MSQRIPALLLCAAALNLSAAAQPAGPNVGAITENAKDSQSYSWIPAGTLSVVCSAADADCKLGDSPAHRITIPNGFWLGRTEVSVAAWKRFTAATGGHMPLASAWNPGWQNDQVPMVMVTWHEAKSFCAWAGGRLPSEAEWEFAARAGNESGGNKSLGNESAPNGELDPLAWYEGNSGRKGRLAVGQKRANAWGLYDMLGNVWEWTTGLYPLTGQNDGPNLPAREGGTFLALRGGSWGDPPRLVGESVRGRAEADHRSNSIGVRCALDGP